MKDMASETEKIPSIGAKAKDFMRTRFSFKSSQEIRKDNGRDFAQKIQDLQVAVGEKALIRAKVFDDLKVTQAMHNQEKDNIRDLAHEGSLTSDHLVNLYQKSQEAVKGLIESGVNPADIETVDGDIAIKQLSDKLENPYSRDRNQAKKTLEAFRAKHKGKSITDQLDQANRDEKVLGAIADETLDYLKNALKLSPKDMSHYRSKVRDIYAHHGDRVSEAHTLYQYYDLQRRQDELKAMSFGKDKLCKQAYNILSLNAHQSRRYKKDVTNILEAEEQRRKHLVEKYGNLTLEKGGKRGKEKRMLDNLIKPRKEKLATDRAFELFNTTLEKCERDIINNRDLNEDERARSKEILKLARENYDRLHLHTEISQIGYTLEKHHISQEHLIRKYGNHPCWGRLNDAASDGGGVLTAGGSVVTGLALGGVAA